MKSTCCSSSTTVTEMSDFPMPTEIGMFPHNIDVREYLESYAENFNLMRHIRLNTSVFEVKKEGETWHVTCSTGDTYTSTYLIVATGAHHTPNRELEETTLKGYTGKVYHATEIKATMEKHKNERLLVLGGGETASDICMEWFNHVKFTYWSIPRGQHFLRKYAKFVPWGKPTALDKASSRMRLMISPFARNKPGVAWICKWITSGSLLAYQGHGIPEWRNDADFYKCFVNKSGRVLDFVDYKRLVPKGGITACNGKTITFVDGTKEEFDLVIMSTGYKDEYPFLPEKYANKDVRHRYRFIFDIEDPSIAFVGLVRPVIGSLVTISELQARFIAKVYRKKISLPTVEGRKEVVQKDFTFWSDYFKNTSQRIQGLVEAFTYGDAIAKQAGIYPDYWSLFKRNPRHWYIAFFSPYNGATYRLNEPEHEEQAIQTMKDHGAASLGFYQYFLILFLRLFLFDFWLNCLSDVKYWIQTSSWWPRIRSWRVTQVLNYAWTIPKRAFFDNKSDDKQESRSLFLQSAQSSIDSSCTRDFEAGNLNSAITANDNTNGKSCAFKCEGLTHRKREL